MRGGIVQIIDETDPLRSDTTLLIAALLALGIPQQGRELFHCTYEHVRGETLFRCVWSLGCESADKRFETSAMEKAWDDGAWLLANPRHPLALMREGVTYKRAFSYTPRFSLDELKRIETPETWIEAGIRNLITLLRGIPRKSHKGIVRFGHDHAAFVPAGLSDDRRTRLLKYVETQDSSERAALARAA
jgi:hypothetical protein